MVENKNLCKECEARLFFKEELESGLCKSCEDFLAQKSNDSKLGIIHLDDDDGDYT